MPAALSTTSPRTLVLLEDGELPLRWHRRMLRHCAGLSEESYRALDGIVAGWDLRIGEDAFRRRLSLEVRRLRDLEAAAEEAPVPERTVIIGPTNTDDGSACLMVQGPAPEILSLGHRLDAAARAVRTAQRDALVTGEIVPFDDGSVAETGQVLSLGRLRYEVLTRSVLETGGIEVPAERFRLSVTVPALTLLGRSDAPGLLEGTVPLPAAMARELAGSEESWYRILTDPVTGAFLPLPAHRYAPSVSMLEHLRTRKPVCAVPGCGRGVRHGAEADHIIPFDHEQPEQGGRTEIENLHLLCRRHHQMKTAGILRPTRNPTPNTTARAAAAASAGSGSTPGTGSLVMSGSIGGRDTVEGIEPGRTTWTFHPDPAGPALHTITHRDEHDLMTPRIVRDLTQCTGKDTSTRDDSYAPGAGNRDHPDHDTEPPHSATPDPPPTPGAASRPPTPAQSPQETDLDTGSSGISASPLLERPITPARPGRGHRGPRARTEHRPVSLEGPPERPDHFPSSFDDPPPF